MGKKKKRKPEIRADTINNETAEIYPSVDIILLNALMGKSVVTKEMAMQIPTVKACVTRISEVIASTPIRLYKKGRNGKVEEITEDRRIFLLNNETGDTLTSVQFWRAMVTDYLVGKGGYAYINSSGLETKSIHYVDEKEISFLENNDPIFKDYDIVVRGSRYAPFYFLKILRNTKDGIKSSSISEENPLLISLAYASLVYEENMVKKGGNKRGFLESEGKLTKEAMDELRKAYKRLYSNNSENVVVLNKGVKFHEASNTSVEMQLNENKMANGNEICKIFGVPAAILAGSATSEDRKTFLRTCVEIMYDIECSLDRDMLLESEKDAFYWAFDTRELLRGDIKERYEAYEIGLKNNFLQIDEVREQEDKEPLGFEWITLGLDSVLYNPKNGSLYTPNTNAVQTMTSLGKPLMPQPEIRAGTKRKVVVVSGPPCSGKTTYTEEHMGADDIVYDFDKIIHAITNKKDHSTGFHAASDIALKMRWAILSEVVKADRVGTVYMIVCDPTELLEKLSEWGRFDVEHKKMDVSEAECLERMEKDESRPDKEAWREAIKKYFLKGDEMK